MMQLRLHMVLHLTEMVSCLGWMREMHLVVSVMRRNRMVPIAVVIVTPGILHLVLEM